LPRPASAQSLLEITTIRLPHDPAICLAPQYLAEELLRLEGFSTVRYVESTSGALYRTVDAGKADLTMDGAPGLVYGLQNHANCVAIAGIHPGCYELFANEQVQTVRDLKGKTIADWGQWRSRIPFRAGVRRHRSARRQMSSTKTGDAKRRFLNGEADAFIGFPPEPQELRAREIGRVILNTAQDRPWSQYFCCILIANRDFATKYPNATKRALRAYLKAADICAAEPERAARFLADRGFEPNYEIGLEVLKSLPYRRWRDSNPEDTLRFHALRLHEVGMIKSTPQKLIAQGTDWRFLNELKKELKA
jgi:NitT/TauT family transport system substrate-binding protein